VILLLGIILECVHMIIWDGQETIAAGTLPIGFLTSHFQHERGDTRKTNLNIGGNEIHILNIIWHCPTTLLYAQRSCFIIERVRVRLWAQRLSKSRGWPWRKFCHHILKYVTPASLLASLLKAPFIELRRAGFSGVDT
jgi:hypothetical protein